VGSTGNLTFTGTTETYTNSVTISAASTKTLTLNGGAGSNGLVLDASNNVGIGTSSPAFTLDVKSTNATGQLQVYKNSGGADNYARLNLSNSTGSYFQLAANPSSTDASSILNVYASGSVGNIMSFLGNGNVGIGTTTPGYKFVIVSQANNGFGFYENGDADGASFRTFRSRGNTSAPAAVQLNDALTGIRSFGYTSAGAYGPRAVAMNFFAAENFTSAAQGTYITFETTPIGSASTIERARLDASGNLGLGVTPNSGWSAGQIALQLPALTALSSGYDYSANLSNNGYRGASGNWYYIQTGQQATLYKQTGGSHQWFNSNNTNGTAGAAWTPNQAMTLDASGRLGLGGVTSPTATLDVGASVSGSLPLRVSHPGNATFGTVIQAKTTGGTDDPVISLENYNGGSPVRYGISCTDNGSLAFSSGAYESSFGTERARIDSSGIVTMKAYGAGAATFSAAGVISSVSDETWKTKDGVPFDTDAMLKKLEPGYWYYNDEKKEIFGVDRQLGFYAQNVNAAIGPEAAPEPEEGKPWGYYDRSVLAVVVMSLQKALATIESLEARIAALESN